MSLFIHQIAIAFSLKCGKPLGVTSCPTTKKEWQKAELRSNCLECPIGVYHCVPDQDGNLVEVCTKSLFLPGKSSFTISWSYHSVFLKTYQYILRLYRKCRYIFKLSYLQLVYALCMIQSDSFYSGESVFKRKVAVWCMGLMSIVRPFYINVSL